MTVELPHDWMNYTSHYRASLEIVPAMQYDVRTIQPMCLRAGFFVEGKPGQYWDRDYLRETLFNYYNPLPNPCAFLIDKIFFSGLNGNLMRGSLRFVIGQKIYVEESLHAAGNEMMISLRPQLLIAPLQDYALSLQWAEPGSGNEKPIDVMVTMVGQKARPVQ